MDVQKAGGGGKVGFSPFSLGIDFSICTTIEVSLCLPLILGIYSFYGPGPPWAAPVSVPLSQMAPGSGLWQHPRHLPSDPLLNGFVLLIIFGFLLCPRFLGISITHVSNKSPAFSCLWSVYTEWLLSSLIGPWLIKHASQIVDTNVLTAVFLFCLVSLRRVLVAAHGIFFWFFSCSMRDLDPWSGMEPRLPALGAWSLSRWTTRQVPQLLCVFNPLSEYVPLPLHILYEKKNNVCYLHYRISNTQNSAWFWVLVQLIFVE